MNNKIAILYVDDEPINLMLFRLNFEKKYVIITAESGQEGLVKLSENTSIQIVISDMKMPNMDGVEFIRKAKEEYPLLEFFILTGFEITSAIADALNEKILNGYFRKPFNIQEIENAILGVTK
jgi:two-component system, response regulator, stage 0 sporulation protein F